MGIKRRDLFSTSEPTGPITFPGPCRNSQVGTGKCQILGTLLPPGHPPNTMGQKGLGLSKHSGAGGEYRELGERHRGHKVWGDEGGEARQSGLG